MDRRRALALNPPTLERPKMFRRDRTLGDPTQYAPFGSPVTVSDENTSNLGWTKNFGPLLTDFPLVSTESGTNETISVQYGGDYLVYLWEYAKSLPPKTFHLLPWAWFADTYCYPSLITATPSPKTNDPGNLISPSGYTVLAGGCPQGPPRTEPFPGMGCTRRVN